MCIIPSSILKLPSGKIIISYDVKCPKKIYGQWAGNNKCARKIVDVTKYDGEECAGEESDWMIQDKISTI